MATAYRAAHCRVNFVARSRAQRLTRSRSQKRHDGRLLSPAGVSMVFRTTFVRVDRLSSNDMSCRGAEIRRAEPPRALQPTSRFRAHDEDDETEHMGRRRTLRSKRGE